MWQTDTQLQFISLLLLYKQLAMSLGVSDRFQKNSSLDLPGLTWQNTFKMHLYVTFYMLTTEKYILLLDVMCWCFTAIVYNTVVTLFTYLFLIDDIKCFDITGRIRKTLADSQLKTSQLICKLCSLLLRARKFCCPIQWTKKMQKWRKKKQFHFQQHIKVTLSHIC